MTVKSQYEYDFRPFLVAHIRMVRSSVKIFAEKLSKHHDFTHRCMGESLLGTSELGIEVTSIFIVQWLIGGDTTILAV